MSASTPSAGAASTPEAMGEFGAGAYAVKLSIFEGPLDLLLHLIRINEVDITDIPIARIGEQYLEYLDMMRELNLDVAGEHLVMAATLAWIKSRMLLPAVPGEGDGEVLDPRAELVARLLEYQRFKEVAGELGERPLLGRDVYAACSPDLIPPPDSEREIEVGLFQLVEAFRQALRHAGPSATAHEVEIETVTVRERMIYVMERLALRDSCEFVELVTESGHWASRAVIVATFLAILELTRLAALGLYQGLSDEGVPQGPIHLRRVAQTDAASWAERISDLM
jgi:segregation and condensation protein A